MVGAIDCSMGPMEKDDVEASDIVLDFVVRLCASMYPPMSTGTDGSCSRCCCCWASVTGEPKVKPLNALADMSSVAEKSSKPGNSDAMLSGIG